jgi:hypothetical protein
MALCVMVLIASEFMPVSLLTPIASDLRMTEGRTGHLDLWRLCGADQPGHRRRDRTPRSAHGAG